MELQTIQPSNPHLIKRARDYGINVCQLMFVLAYIKRGCGSREGTAAYMEAYPDAKPKSAGVQASRLLAKPSIQDAIGAELEIAIRKANVCSEYIIDELMKVFDDDDATWSDKARCADLIGKHLDMWKTAAGERDLPIIIQMDMTGQARQALPIEGEMPVIDASTHSERSK